MNYQDIEDILNFIEENEKSFNPKIIIPIEQLEKIKNILTLAPGINIEEPKIYKTTKEINEIISKRNEELENYFTEETKQRIKDIIPDFTRHDLIKLTDKSITILDEKITKESKDRKIKNLLLNLISPYELIQVDLINNDILNQNINLIVRLIKSDINEMHQPYVTRVSSKVVYFNRKLIILKKRIVSSEKSDAQCASNRSEEQKNNSLNEKFQVEIIIFENQEFELALTIDIYSSDEQYYISMELKPTKLSLIPNGLNFSTFYNRRKLQDIKIDASEALNRIAAKTIELNNDEFFGYKIVVNEQEETDNISIKEILNEFQQAFAETK